MAQAYGVQWVGLAEFMKKLASLEGKLDRELSRELQKAADLVMDEAKARMPSRSGRARGSLYTKVSGTTVSVSERRSDVKYVGWLDFGSRNPVSGQARRVGPWTHSGSGPSKGRYLYPAIDSKIHEVVDIIAAGILRLQRETGLS